MSQVLDKRTADARVYDIDCSRLLAPGETIQSITSVKADQGGLAFSASTPGNSRSVARRAVASHGAGAGGRGVAGADCPAVGLQHNPLMCNRYETAEEREVERFWHVGRQNEMPWPKQVFPRAPGPFIRRRRRSTGYEPELVIGQWGLIPGSPRPPS